MVDEYIFFAPPPPSPKNKSWLRPCTNAQVVDILTKRLYWKKIAKFRKELGVTDRELVLKGSVGIHHQLHS